MYYTEDDIFNQILKALLQQTTFYFLSVLFIIKEFYHKTNDREIIYESQELMKINSVYFSLANSIKTQ